MRKHFQTFNLANEYWVFFRAVLGLHFLLISYWLGAILQLLSSGGQFAYSFSDGYANTFCPVEKITLLDLTSFIFNLIILPWQSFIKLLILCFSNVLWTRFNIFLVYSFINELSEKSLTGVHFILARVMVEPLWKLYFNTGDRIQDDVAVTTLKDLSSNF